MYHFIITLCSILLYVVLPVHIFWKTMQRINQGYPHVVSTTAASHLMHSGVTGSVGNLRRLFMLKEWSGPVLPNRGPELTRCQDCVNGIFRYQPCKHGLTILATSVNCHTFCVPRSRAEFHRILWAHVAAALITMVFLQCNHRAMQPTWWIFTTVLFAVFQEKWIVIHVYGGGTLFYFIFCLFVFVLFHALWVKKNLYYY